MARRARSAASSPLPRSASTSALLLSAKMFELLKLSARSNTVSAVAWSCSSKATTNPAMPRAVASPAPWAIAARAWRRAGAVLLLERAAEAEVITPCERRVRGGIVRLERQRAREQRDRAVRILRNMPISERQRLQHQIVGVEVV